jgi:imidazolonepropionase-like amidohydrolase
MFTLLTSASIALAACAAAGERPQPIELSHLLSIDGTSESTPDVDIAAAAETVIAIRAKHLHLGDGRTVENGVLVVRGGVIVAAGEVEVPADAYVVEHDGHVSPGLVAAYSAGYIRWTEANENTRPFMPDVRMALGFDPELPALDDALAAGVTTVVLAPGVSQVVGGRTAVVKTHGGRVLSDNAHLALSLAAQAASTERYPTSYASITAELDARFTDAQGAYREAQTGNLGLASFVRAQHETDRALRLYERHSLKGALVGCVLPGELAPRLERAQVSVVLPSTGFAPNERELASLADLAAAKVPFAFWLDDPDLFRVSAAVARRAGASADEALGSITWYAADIARVGTSVGRLSRGFDADFVLWSGDPLDLTSRVEAVYVAGELAFGGVQ